MDMNTLSLNELASRCEVNSRKWFPHLHDHQLTSRNELIKHYGLGLAEEAGEVVGVIKKMTGYRAGQSRHSTVKDMGYELVDVLVYLLNIASALDIDLESALVDKTAECERRWGATPL